MRILYVEDEKYLAEAVIHVLKKSKIMVDWADNGDDGLKLALEPHYDCIVLDIMLPGLSGLEILETIRKRGIKTPVIMLSALGEVEDKINGLETGADDYLAKPFKTAELIARINAITRRPHSLKTELMTFSDLTFDLSNRTLNHEPLSDKEAAILEMLLKDPSLTITKSQILAHVWGPDSEHDENYVEVYMSYLRKKIKALGSKVKIKTIRGLGYKIVGDEDV